MHQQKFYTIHLTQDEDAQDRYNEKIIQEIKSNLHPETTVTRKCDLLKSIIKNAAESQVGYMKEENSIYISDSEIERMSIEQKDLRLQIEKCQNLEQIKQLGNQERTYSNKLVKK